MPGHSNSFNRPGINKLMFISGLFALLFCFLTKSWNVYNYSITGAVFELLWLPVMIIVFIGPIFSISLFFKDNYNPRSLALYAAILQLTAMMILIFFKRF